MPHNPKAFDLTLALAFYKERRLLVEQSNLLKGAYKSLDSKYQGEGLDTAVAAKILGACEKLGKVLAPQENIEQMMVVAYQSLGYSTQAEEQVPLPLREDANSELAP